MPPSQLVVLASLPLGLVVILMLWLVRAYFSPVPNRPTRTVALLVLGDLGRSPRMMYHAKSFADHGFLTTLIGYSGSNILPSLLSLPNFRTILLPAPPKIIQKAPRALFLVAAPIKVVLQICSILEILLWQLQDPPEFILVQNPPSIPTLAIVQLVCLVRGSKLIIDWHNLGYSILALKLGPTHPLVKIAKRFERVFGRHAYAHLFVTKAMRNWVCQEWKLTGKKAVLHDRPPDHFHSCDPAETHDLFTRLLPTFSPSITSFLPSSKPPLSTPLTQQRSTSSLSARTTSSFVSIKPLPSFREDRPAILISSTSWTPDEDFSILLDALSLYEVEAREQEGMLPKVLMVISGKGPGREAFEKEVERRMGSERWVFVRVWCGWVHVEDYPKLLGSADLGISLHSSSSALDLPMKIVDMFGCRLPVCSLDFACLDELVQDGKNGYIFQTANQLSSQISELLSKFPSSLNPLGPTDQLATFRSTIEEDQVRLGSWKTNWDRVVRPLVVKGTDGGVEISDEL